MKELLVVTWIVALVGLLLVVIELTTIGGVL